MPSISRLGIHRGLDLLDGADQRRQPLERVVLALHRDEHALRGDQRVQREHVQRRRAVDEDDFVLVVDGLERVAQLELAARHGSQQADFGGGQVLVGRHEREAGRGLERR